MVSDAELNSKAQHCNILFVQVESRCGMSKLKTPISISSPITSRLCLASLMIIIVLALDCLIDMF
jgi:hypothetical protein